MRLRWSATRHAIKPLLDQRRFLRDSLPATLRRFDKGGENFYDQISALHKSVRGSDPDASLYWMVRMFDGGVDPRYVARRAIRMAAEDIGLADPRALEVALAAADTYERLGSPEGELALAQAIVYLACAPKSNAVYRAYGAVRAFVEQDGSRPVPMHLRNAPTRLMKELGYGEGYRYAHNEAGAVAAGETYLPEGVTAQAWYQPTDRGVEARIAERLAELRRMNAGRRRNDHRAKQSSIRRCSISPLLRKDVAAVAARLKTRGYELDVERFNALEAERKAVQTKTEELQARRNALSKQVGVLKAKGQDASSVLAEAGSIPDQVKTLENAAREYSAEAAAVDARSPELDPRIGAYRDVG